MRDDLPLIDEAVTVEHLLAHRSGIGDYLDEEAGTGPEDYVLPVSPHVLNETERYLPVLEGRPAKFAAGTRFSYSNSGYVVLALIAERVAGAPFRDLVAQRVCMPAGMRDTAFLRSDELPDRTAAGYLEGTARTNVFHLPVRGSGDGGIYTTVADVSALWRALFGGRIVPSSLVAEATAARSEAVQPPWSYGLGFWVDPARGEVMLEGSDAGVSFRSVHHPGTASGYTVVSNTTRGAWPLVAALQSSHVR